MLYSANESPLGKAVRLSCSCLDTTFANDHCIHIQSFFWTKLDQTAVWTWWSSQISYFSFPLWKGTLHLPACLDIIVAFIFTLCLDIAVIALVEKPRSSSVNAAGSSRCVAELHTACQINCEWYYYFSFLSSSTCSLLKRASQDVIR